MMVWMMRIWLLSHRMELDDDPVIFALKDPASLLLGLGVALAFLVCAVALRLPARQTRSACGRDSW